MAGKRKPLDESVHTRMTFLPESRRAIASFRERMLKKGTYIPSDENAINMLIVIGNKADKGKSRK